MSRCPFVHTIVVDGVPRESHCLREDDGHDEHHMQVDIPLGDLAAFGDDQ